MDANFFTAVNNAKIVINKSFLKLGRGSLKDKYVFFVFESVLITFGFEKKTWYISAPPPFFMHVPSLIFLKFHP